jgi:outer membrane protein insertion porin family
MKLLFRFCGLCVLFAWLPMGWGQATSYKVARIEIKHVGPMAASDEMIRANIRVKAGDPYRRTLVDDDVRGLYATGFFYNIRVADETAPEGVVLTYIVQGKPRLTDIKFQGNRKLKDAKLRKKLSSKAGDPLDERKLFTDSQEIQKLYQSKGYPGTQVKYVLNIDENAGRGTATFEVTEGLKVKILDVNFVGAQAFPQKQLRGGFMISGGVFKKTRRHWWLSWLTSHGFLKDEEFEEDKTRLTEFYRDKGYIDFELKDVQFQHPTGRSMVIRLMIDEGTQYKVGSVKITGNKLFSTADIVAGMRALHAAKHAKSKLGPNGLEMDGGDVFTPKGVAKDIEAVEDFYGARGYIDVNEGSRNLKVLRIPNTETHTMDIEFQIEEGQKSYIEKIEIRGNTTTRDKVIRRELAVSPGEVFDMVRVKLSKQRLEGLQYFERVETRPEPTEPPIAGRKDLVVGVDEKQTAHVSLGAGFSSVDSLVGTVEYNEGNFDLFHPFQAPWFRGGGQKLRLHMAVGTVQQVYEASFIEPWFLGRKLALGVDLFYRDLAYLSPNDLYTEIQEGGKVGVTRALGNDFLRGGLNYTPENIGIHLTSDARTTWTTDGAPNVPQAILDQVGYHLLSTLGGSLAYDTRNSVQLPDKGQRTEVTGQVTGGPLGGDASFYKLELRSAWFFKGFFPRHVLEVGGRAGVAQAFDSTADVPFYSRYYLGGMYDLRGFKYRNISPRQSGYDEPIGGDSFWFGSAEYSLPIIEQEHGIGLRFAVFYDIGSVGANPYNFNASNFSDNWGIGFRINLPIGPIRLDYGFPIHHDQYNSPSGQFQFGVGWERPF